MKNYYKKSVLLIALLLCVTMGFSQDYSEGIFIINEGQFGVDNASVSYFSDDGTLENGVFSTQNNEADLGNLAQGMGFQDDFAYVVLNGSNAVKVVNRITFELVTSITDQMNNPRNIAFYEGKGYVTNWGDPSDTEDDFVAIIDLATNTVTGTISVVEGPEEIVQQDGKLFVAHQGGFGYGTTVSAIETDTNTVTEITVGDVPSALKIDDENLYVLCSGKPEFTGDETNGKLVKIDLADYQNKTEYDFGAAEHPGFMDLDDTELYYVLNNDIYKMGLNDTALPSDSFIETTPQDVQLAYGFNKIDDTFYLADAVDYVGDGKVYVFADDGSFLDEYTVGLIPSGFYKNKDSNLGLDTVEATAVALYPNPASESFKLDIATPATITLYDLSGRMVKTTDYNNEAISLAGLNAGMYLVHIETEGKTTTQKLLVQ